MKTKKLSSEILTYYCRLIIDFNTSITQRNKLWDYSAKKYKKHGYDWYLTKSGHQCSAQVNKVVHHIEKLRNKINQINMVLQHHGITANKYVFYLPTKELLTEQATQL